MKASKRVCQTPMAITGAGEVALNAAMSNGSTVPSAVLRRALDHGGKVFIDDHVA